MIFHQKKAKLDYNVKFKLNSKTLIPTGIVKYLGMLKMKTFYRQKKVNQVNSKLKEAIEVISKFE